MVPNIPELFPNIEVFGGVEKTELGLGVFKPFPNWLPKVDPKIFVELLSTFWGLLVPKNPPVFEEVRDEDWSPDCKGAPGPEKEKA